MASSSTYNQTFSSSASSSPTSWDVFISFRGIDTRFKFTSHLYAALDCHALRTFKGDGMLSTGDLVFDSLLQPIQNSKTYIVVFSENYASSRWCLDDLVEIVICCETMQRLVIPVFYNIDPSVVRNQSGSFNEAFEKHETRFDMDRLAKWRAALTKVGNLSGYQVCENMSEANMINKVVDKVLLTINPMTLDVAEYPVGLDSRVEGITSLLSGPIEGVLRFGIYGMGGVGKTTLAKALYNHNYHRFQGSCFLANVREVLGTGEGLEYLQQQLMNDVLKCKNIKVDSVDQGIELIRARICSTRVLIVIDDLDDPAQLDFLEGPFAVGSIIIITTRNEDLLDSIKVEARYKVNELGVAESRQLFSQHAFGHNEISDTYMELSKDILERAGGLPLALKIFGSNLLNQSQEGCICVDKLKRDSLDEVGNKIMISFDALKLVDPVLQEIFLDISSFFIGQKKKEVVEILETCYMFANHYIDILKKRCLLTINIRDELGMQVLLQDMGRKIVCNNSYDDPGKYSRLWTPKDISDVLKNEKGTEAIEGIIPHNLNYQDALEEVSFATTAFKRMSKLRFLYLQSASLSGSFEHIFEDLRFLYWECCPLKCLPSQFYPQKLVTLSLPRSKMRTMWALYMVPKVFEKLKTLNMSYSQDFIITPDFTTLPALETLNLEGCESLEEVHISIGSLARLVSLNLCGCAKLKSLPDSICNLRALKVLTVGNCSSLEALPTEFGNIGSLRELNAEGLSVWRIPNSIGRLSKLVELKINHNQKLQFLPVTICNLKALKVLNIRYCASLKALPTGFGNIESLEELNAEGLTVSKLPDSIGSLCNLVELNLDKNPNLQTLPNNICNLRALKVLKINSCTSLDVLPPELGNIESLEVLNAEWLSVSRLPDSIGRLSKLVELRLSFNRKLLTLPDSICNLRALELLHIGHCSRLDALPIEIGAIDSLKELNAEGLTVWTLPDSIGHLSNLVELPLKYNNELRILPDTICNLRALKVLDISGCSKLILLPDQLWKLTRLTELKAGGANLLNKLPDIKSSQVALSLKKLDLSKSGLTSLPSGISHLSNLEYLNLRECRQLLFIAELPPNLKRIMADGCTSLNSILDLTNFKQLEIMGLTSCSGLREIQGLEQLTSIRSLCLAGCSSSLLTYTFTKHFLQTYSGFGRIIEIYAGAAELKWVNQSSHIGSAVSLDFVQDKTKTETKIKTKSKSKAISSISARDKTRSKAKTKSKEVSLDFELDDKFKNSCTGDLQPKAAHSFLALILFFSPPEFSSSSRFSYNVNTTTSYFKGEMLELDTPYSRESVMVIVPRSIFLISDDDRTIKLEVTNAEILGIQLLYESES